MSCKRGTTHSRLLAVRFGRLRVGRRKVKILGAVVRCICVNAVFFITLRVASYFIIRHSVVGATVFEAVGVFCNAIGHLSRKRKGKEQTHIAS